MNDVQRPTRFKFDLCHIRSHTMLITLHPPIHPFIAGGSLCPFDECVGWLLLEVSTCASVGLLRQAFCFFIACVYMFPCRRRLNVSVVTTWGMIGSLLWGPEGLTKQRNWNDRGRQGGQFPPRAHPSLTHPSIHPCTPHTYNCATSACMRNRTNASLTIHTTVGVSSNETRLHTSERGHTVYTICFVSFRSSSTSSFLRSTANKY